MIRPIRSLQDSSLDTLGYFRNSPAESSGFAVPQMVRNGRDRCR